MSCRRIGRRQCAARAHLDAPAGLASVLPRGYFTANMSPSVATTLSDVSLPDVDGREVRLGSFWESGPAVLVFLRHYG